MSFSLYSVWSALSLSTFVNHGQWMLSALWEGWKRQVHAWSIDPAYGEYYHTAGFVLTFACFLLLIVLLYYMARCVSKTLSWTIDLTFRLAVALLMLSLAMCVFFVAVPWMAQSVGLDQWFGGAAGGEAAVSMQALKILRSDSPNPEELQYETITLPKVGDDVYRNAKHRWVDVFRDATGLALPDIEHEWEQIWATHTGTTGWILWTAVRHGVGAAGQGLWFIATSAGAAGLNLVQRVVQERETKGAAEETFGNYGNPTDIS